MTADVILLRHGSHRTRAAHPHVKHYLVSTLCVDDRIVEVCAARIREKMAEERVEAGV